MSSSLIWPIDKTLSTTPDQIEPGSDGNEGLLPIPKAPALLKPRYRIV